jgi:ATP phosphoribosyltransferase regulatory subunit
MTTFHHYGFKNIQTPTFEFYEVFNHERGTLDVVDMFKFFDRDGHILVLRPDITPSLARFVSTFYKHDLSPKRLCYNGMTFRNNKNYQGKLKEFTQLGCEFFGVDSADADAEMIAIAINSLLATGLKEFKIDIGHAGYFKGLVEEAGIEDAYQEELRYLIDEKNFVAVEELLDSFEIDQMQKQMLLDLPKLFGNLNVLEKAKSTTRSIKAIEAIDRLEKVYDILRDYGVEKYISFDLGMVSQLNYYTGTVFRGYTYETGVSIFDGGRYDTLLAQFGKDMKAVGFAIILDDLAGAIVRQDIKIPVFSINTLLVYNDDTRKEAIRVSEQMRNDGMSIELSLMDQEIKQHIAYGKANNIGGLMYFKEADIVELINLETDETSTTNTKALI